MKQVMQMDNQQLQKIYRSQLPKNLLKAHTSQVKQQLRNLGAFQYDLMLPETDTLSLVVQPGEIIEGIVYGKYSQDTRGGLTNNGRGALVITDRRVLLIDRKPFFTQCREISYGVVTAISYGRVGFAGTVVLHTKLGNISFRTFNQNCAHSFVEAAEDCILSGREQHYDYATYKRAIPAHRNQTEY